MATRRNKRKNRRKSRNKRSRRSWTTAIEAAQMELERSGSVTKANRALKSQALLNARKIFGSVGKTGGGS